MTKAEFTAIVRVPGWEDLYNMARAIDSIFDFMICHDVNPYEIAVRGSLPGGQAFGGEIIGYGLGQWPTPEMDIKGCDSVELWVGYLPQHDERPVVLAFCEDGVAMLTMAIGEDGYFGETDVVGSMADSTFAVLMKLAKQCTTHSVVREIEAAGFEAL